jgi:hypothetical protein
VEEVRQLSRRNLALAQEAGMVVYAAMAHANLAWVAWRDGRLDEGRAQGHAALDAWQQSEMQYPFQWAARWPLLAVELMAGDLTRAIEHARALLDPQQQRQPDALAAILEKAIQAEEGSQSEGARASLERSVELARELRYL